MKPDFTNQIDNIEEVVEKYYYELSDKDWIYISKYQVLSEKFIEKYKDLVDWLYISRYQILSEEFIKKYKDKVSWIF